jgi:hypothetical protein
MAECGQADQQGQNTDCPIRHNRLDYGNHRPRLLQFDWQFEIFGNLYWKMNCHSFAI